MKPINLPRGLKFTLCSGPGICERQLGASIYYLANCPTYRGQQIWHSLHEDSTKTFAGSQTTQRESGVVEPNQNRFR